MKTVHILKPKLAPREFREMVVNHLKELVKEKGNNYLVSKGGKGLRVKPNMVCGFVGCVGFDMPPESQLVHWVRIAKEFGIPFEGEDAKQD